MSNNSARVVGHRMVGMASLGRGDLVKAKGHFERSLELFLLEPDNSATQMFGQNPQVHGRCLLSLTYYLLGDVDGALQTVLDTLQSAEELEHAHSKALALSYAGLIMAMSRCAGRADGRGAAADGGFRAARPSPVPGRGQGFSRMGALPAR